MKKVYVKFRAKQTKHAYIWEGWFWNGITQHLLIMIGRVPDEVQQSSMCDNNEISCAVAFELCEARIWRLAKVCREDSGVMPTMREGVA